jgi:hypothetical protein
MYLKIIGTTSIINMAPTIILSKDFDVSNVSFSDAKTLDNGGKIVYVSYNKTPFILQTPQMSVPFGLSKWDNDGKVNPKYTLDLSFKNMDASSHIQAFYKVLETLDNHLIESGFKNQATWFKGKKFSSKEIVEALYTPLIKHAKDKETGERTDKYPATFKMTIPYKDNNFLCDVYNADHDIVDLENIETKSSKVTAIIQCTGLWFAGGKFGSSWKAVQLKCVQSSSSIKGFAIQEQFDEAVDDSENANDVVEVPVPSTGDGGKESSSDEDDEGEDEVDAIDNEELPVPPPVKKTSTIQRRKK